MKKYLVAAIVLFASSAYAQTPPSLLPGTTSIPSQPITVDLEYYQNRISELDLKAALLTTEKKQLQQEANMLRKQLADAQAAAKKAAEDAKPAKDAAPPHKP